MPLFAEAPDLDARRATVFWAPEASPEVLPALALPAGSRQEAPALRLSELRCRADLLLAPDGRQYLLLRDGCHGVQLAVAGASLLEGGHLLVDALAVPRLCAARLAALARLDPLFRLGRLPRRLAPPAVQSRRLRQVLCALDGWRAGLAYREIAVALYGRARVEADWRDPRDHLRDRVRRAVRRGRALTEGGYRQLLR